ncbi:hypothetical protein BDN72DRAFT_450169 [Pluteus cervinus]|uniref:Uncharacterized protein n=1 Tax=Pluteus cervinus TaxID=181527 RepID=A0ACD3BD89_9AGAR|nr:hypothetical protein BDN72DRAFT_450169 [Pluteus cervinus]
MLSSIIGIRRKPKPTKQPGVTNTARRYNATPPATFHPYTDNDIFHNGNYPTPAPSSSQTSLPKPVSYPDPNDVPPRPSLSSLPSQSPKVQLDLELHAEPIDWFGSTRSTGAVEGGGAKRVRPTTGTSVSPGDSRRVNGRHPDRLGLAGDKRSDVEKSPPPTATNGTKEYAQSARISTQSNHTAKRQPPTPIIIPNTGIVSTKVESPELSRQPSVADSAVSDSDSSAVSGTTLARAILGNTFVLSADTRLSRHRSGMSLNRADSATLPRDNAYLNSPYWRDGSGVSPVSGGLLSPMPPVPLDAGQVYVPPRTPRTPRQVMTNRTDIRPPESKKWIGRIVPENDLANTHLNAVTRISETQAARRISRISEASTAPSTPETTYNTPKKPSPNGVELSPPSQSEAGSPLTPQLPAERPETPQEPRTPLPALPTTPPRKQQQPEQHSPTSIRSLRQSAEGHDNDTPTSTVPHSSPSRSSVSSAKDIGDVLDYYSFMETPEPVAHLGFRPQFSPISEESPSQLSPQSLGRRRESQRSQASSINLPSVHSREWTLSRQYSVTSTSDASSSTRQLLPIGERPQSIQSPASEREGPSSFYIQHNGTRAPSLVSKVFNRQRSGSAPSPIRVMPNPREKNYNISVGPLTVDVRLPPNKGRTQQTFPETPSAFSPMWTPQSRSPSATPAVEHESFSFFPVTPSSGSISRRESLQRTLSQKVLLSRAGSTPKARNQRQASVRARLGVSHPYARPRPSSLNMDFPVAVGTKSANEDGLWGAVKMEHPSCPENGMVVDLTFRASASESAEDTVETDGFPKDAVSRDSVISTDFSSLYGFSPVVGSQNSPRSWVVGLAPLDPPHALPAAQPGVFMHETSPSPTSPSPQQSEPTSPVLEGILLASAYSSTGSLPLPQHPRESSSPSSPPQPDSASVQSSHASLQPLALTPMAQSPSLSAPQTPVRALTNQSSSSTLSYMTNPSAEHLVLNGTSATSGISSTTIDTSPSSSSHVKHGLPNDLESPEAASFGEPPSYDIAISEHGHGTGNMTPDMGSSIELPGRTPLQLSPFTPLSAPAGAQGQQAAQSHLGTGAQTAAGAGLSRTFSAGRRQLVRPPLPFGPRRPSQPTTVVAAANSDNRHERNASVSSITSNAPTGHRLRSIATPGPRFQIPPVKWRGYTMDAAKWTFTSAQLQDIVSRAVKQSAEPSSIRLLKLETVDTDIPEEKNRLELQRTDVKTRYKMLARRRSHLLETLLAQLDGTEPEDPAFSLRLVEELKEMSITLDKAAEELHSLDEQLAQLRLLSEVHSSSALAMALRKLNASLLRQFSENQTLKEQIDLLEGERDLAWKQAQDVADDFDNLHEKIVDGRTSPPSRRSSRVSAARKSSVRATKAGLKSSGMRSARSSMTSNSHRISWASTTQLTSAVEDIPPVPPIPRPRRRPNNIVTDARRVSRTSQGLSTDPTPNSETRALFRAQEELYEMLGIPPTEKKVQRSRSLIARGGLAVDEESSYSQLTPAISPRLRRRSSVLGLQRPTSLPGDSRMSGVYSAITLDQQALLATLSIISANDS